MAPPGHARPDSAARLHVILAVAAVLGAGTGLVVAGFDWLVHDQTYERILARPLWVAALAPALGLAVAVLSIRHLAGGDGTTTDAFIKTYHEGSGKMQLRALPAKVLACAATLGSGAAFGYEGPAIAIGGSIGSFAERRFMGRFTQDDAKVLMVAGAGAGVAAVFKAPLTGIVFALEVPYLRDVARRALLPCLVAAGVSYLVFVSILGTERVLSFGGDAPFDRRDLLGGIAVGLVCGLLARVGAIGIGYAKRVTIPMLVRVPLAGGALAALAVLSHEWFDAPLTLGSGYEAIAWAGHHDASVGLLVLLFAMRFGATWITAAGGGVGGLFIPLVTQGALVGYAVQAVVDAKNPGLFPVVGIAAFLGGGYHTPLAGVAFVAEATGQPGFVVPALLAAAASQIAIGRYSFSPYQREQRQPEIVPTTRLALREIMSPNPDIVEAEVTVDVAALQLMRSNRRWAPVVDAYGYAGILSIADIGALPVDSWPELRSVEVARRDVPAADVGDTVALVAARMRASAVDAIAVTDQGKIVGVVTARDIANVERLLDHLSDSGDM